MALPVGHALPGKVYLRKKKRIAYERTKNIEVS